MCMCTYLTKSSCGWCWISLRLALVLVPMQLSERCDAICYHLWFVHLLIRKTRTCARSIWSVNVYVVEQRTMVRQRRRFLFLLHCPLTRFVTCLIHRLTQKRIFSTAVNRQGYPHDWWCNWISISSWESRVSINSQWYFFLFRWNLQKILFRSSFSRYHSTLNDLNSFVRS